jgi:zinc D-Ala-D-Ala carboxypeptidase
MAFDLLEYTRSATATRLNIDNTPTEYEINNLKRWHLKIREPLEYKLGVELTITSGYRSIALNRALGSKDTSQHITGEAVDFIVKGYTPTDLYHYILDKTKLPFDQLILEYPKANGWIHISYRDNPRGQNFIIG